ncbi:MAG: extracellular solute-binding protein [Clostridia bacterium]|nr:extracellular solute-binding protein [Clostridia bacterium]
MNRLFRKLLLVLACVSVLAVAACGGGTASEKSGDSGEGAQITLKIESAAPLKNNYNALLRSEKEGTNLYNQAMFSKALVEGFRELYPNVKLQFQEDGWGEALYQAQTLMIRDYQSGGSLPDIMIGETYMSYYAQNGLFAELDANKFSNVVKSVISDVTIDGKIYAVPMCTSIFGLQYNTNILTEAGIPESEWIPATWADLLANCKKVSEYAAANGKNYGGFMMNNVSGLGSWAFRALPFLRQAGGDFMKNGELTIDSEENIEAFGFLRELAKYSYADSLTTENEDTLQDYFINKNRSAYMIEGAWPMAKAGDNIKSAKLPTKNADGTGVGNAVTGNVLFGITQSCKNKEAAENFLAYLTSAKVQELVYRYDGRLPINSETLASEEIKTIQPNINPYIDELLSGGFGGGIPCFTKNTSDIWAAMGTFYRNVLTTDTSIESLCSSVQAAVKAKM